MKKTHVLKAALLSGAFCSFMTIAARGDVLYDNTSNQSIYQLNPSTLEVGDEIILNGGGTTVTNFSFQYYASGLSATATVEVRFYANNGSPFAGQPSPNTLLWDSGPAAAIINTTGGTLSYNLMGSPVSVPNSFTWTVQFSNLNTGSAGVPIFTPPTSGGNYLDYWENDGSFVSPVWILKTNPTVNVDFAARVQGVPEPSVAAFAAIAGAGLLARLRRKK